MEKKMTMLLTCHGLGFLFSHILFYYKIILACQVVLLLVQFPSNFPHHLSPISYSLSYTPFLSNVTWQIDMLFKLISLSLFLAPLVFPALCFLMLLFSFFLPAAHLNCLSYMEVIHGWSLKVTELKFWISDLCQGCSYYILNHYIHDY